MTKKDYQLIAECITREIIANWVCYSAERASFTQKVLFSFLDYFGTQEKIRNPKYNTKKMKNKVWELLIENKKVYELLSKNIKVD